jgi:hypothetical protein
VAKISETTGELKESKSALGAEALSQVGEWTPSTLLSLGSRMMLRALPFNLVVTNVPGPQVPLYVLGRGRSFRTRRLEHLIRHGTPQFTVFGEAETPDRRIPLGVEGSADGIRARIAGARAPSLAELALALPVQIIDPEVHHLIEEGPSRRRRFLDWGVFHVEQSFVIHWQRYRQALKQRNAALKSGQDAAAVKSGVVGRVA